ncbi:hypothetical protein M1L60_25155 [Actinoplanes sp. TRM 88003]|uniref:Uncharacterized protein n=1 Tax=Paractinoplanes aksuensis TaxID=2939490 RepID=A0ABT1DSR6_9ACTN|nr:hypothetical protein [Actinoplanes aksuensis]MCO8273890.1 hypothetical protein [Actinoplanes aksuensis]
MRPVLSMTADDNRNIRETTSRLLGSFSSAFFCYADAAGAARVNIEAQFPSRIPT